MRYARNKLMTFSILIASVNLRDITQESAEDNFNQPINDVQQYVPDTTGKNKRYKNLNEATSDNQSQAKSDIEALGRPRRDIIANKELPSNAHNIKILVKKIV